MPTYCRKSRVPPSVSLLLAVGLSAIPWCIEPKSASAQVPSSQPKEDAPSSVSVSSTRPGSRIVGIFRRRSPQENVPLLPRRTAPFSAVDLRSQGVSIDPGVNRTQGPPPPRPWQEPGRGEAGPAMPPLPPGITMPSGPVVPPRSEATSAPISGDVADAAPSPIVPPMTRSTPADPTAP